MGEADDAIRDALDRHLAPRRADTEFTERIRARIEQDRPILDRLADADGFTPPPYSGCRPPQIGDVVWHRGQEHTLVGSDADGRPLLRLNPPEPEPSRPLADRIIERLWCPACLRARFNPGHWLSCH